MGIIGKIVTKAVEKVVTYKAVEVAVDTCDKIEKKAKDNKNKKVDVFLSTETTHARLVLTQKRYTFKESFHVFDENKEVKYIIKGKLFSSTHKLSVYDKTGKNKLGEVNQKRIVLRSPLSLESHPKDFVVILGNKKIGTIKSRYSFAKHKFEFDFNGWIIEGNIIGSKYKIRDERETIMEVYEKLWFGEDTYFVDVFNPDNEVLCLMVALAIDSSHSSKSHDNKRALKHKGGGWI